MEYSQMDEQYRQRVDNLLAKSKGSKVGDQADIVEFIFSAHDFSGVDLREVNLSGIYLVEANFSGVDLSNAILRDVKLWGADLSNANLTGACIDGASLSYGSGIGSHYFFNIPGANLSGANLTNASLWGANLSEANLTNSTLNNASLLGSHLNEANLTNATLNNANLWGANLVDANLNGANFSGANLSEANFSRANLSNAKLQESEELDYAYLKDAIYNDATQFPQDFSPEAAGMIKVTLQDFYFEGRLGKIEILDNIYEHILTGICSLNEISREDEDNLGQYLQSLKPYAIKLWQSYRSERVNIDYHDYNAQAAYLIRYYPHYAQMTREVFDSLSPDILPFRSSSLQACFFGAGPVPEAIGLINYLKHKFLNINAVKFNAYDIAADSWWISRDITRNYLVPPYWDRQFILNAYALNLCEINALDKIKTAIKNSSLFMVQNCLNEFVNSSELFVENIAFLVSEMPANSIIIIADQNNYSSVVNLMRKTESRIMSIPEASVIRSHSAGLISLDSLNALPPIPQVIRENLLTGEDKLIPRRWISFNYIAIQKKPSNISI
jgi:uncharacterized protein YjbI with pentapeptide repeats